MDDFRPSGLLWRIAFSLALVVATFNPSGHSYYHWVAGNFPSFTPAQAVVGILLLGAWLFFVRSTFTAMGTLGVGLLVAFFAAVVWWLVSQGWLDVADRSTMAWVVLAILGVVLGVGMSWSLLRQKASGQASVDRVDG